MDVFSIFKKEVVSIVQNLDLVKQTENISSLLDNIAIETPKDSKNGDISTNAAMVLSKKLKVKPSDLAVEIVAKLKKNENIQTVHIAGPGFINMILKPKFWQKILKSVSEQGLDFGISNINKGKKINIEYVSANPTGPMHIGHARAAVYGDVLANILERSGYEVTREYYINDAGVQIQCLTRSVLIGYLELIGEKTENLDNKNIYKGSYIKDVSNLLKDKYGNSLKDMEEQERNDVISNFSLEIMMKMIKSDLLRLGTKHDIFISEKAIQDNGGIEKALKILEEKKVIYLGVLDCPKGSVVEDWESKEQLLFRSTLFGDDVDRVIKKSDGSWTYFASDLAYHLNKYNRGFNEMILLVGADHSGYVKRIKAGMNVLSDNQVNLKCHSMQLVNFIEEGKAIKMSKREGKFITVNEVLDKVGKDVTRFIMLTRKNDVVIDFDLDLAQEKSKDNPVFYIQYAYARACSVLRHAKSEVPDFIVEKGSVDSKILSCLSSNEELNLIKMIALWPKIFDLSCAMYEPHRIAFYLQELSSSFHSLWNKGKENNVLRFIITDNKEVTIARLFLIDCFTIIVASALNLLNIEILDSM